jgi:hypothetical protein
MPNKSKRRASCIYASSIAAEQRRQSLLNPDTGIHFIILSDLLYVYFIVNTTYLLGVKLFRSRSAGDIFFLLSKEFKPTVQDSKLNLDVIKKLEGDATVKKTIIGNLYLSEIYIFLTNN